MRISFEDKSYIQAEKTPTGKIVISVGAKSQDDPLSVVQNTAELTEEEFRRLISEL